MFALRTQVLFYLKLQGFKVRGLGDPREGDEA